MAKIRVYVEIDGRHMYAEENTTALCGMNATLDMSPGYPSYRCDHCMAVLGSIAVCSTYRNLEKLKNV